MKYLFVFLFPVLLFAQKQDDLSDVNINWPNSFDDSTSFMYADPGDVINAAKYNALQRAVIAIQEKLGMLGSDSVYSTTEVQSAIVATVNDSSFNTVDASVVIADTFQNSTAGGIYFHPVMETTKMRADTFELSEDGVFYRNEDNSYYYGMELYNTFNGGKNAYLNHWHMNHINLNVVGGRTKIDRLRGQEPEDRYMIWKRASYDDKYTVDATGGLYQHHAFPKIAFDGDTIICLYRTAVIHGYNPSQSYIQLRLGYQKDTSDGLFEFVNKGNVFEPSGFDPRTPNITFLSDDSLFIIVDMADTSNEKINCYKSGDNGRNWVLKSVLKAYEDSTRFACTQPVIELENGELGVVYYSYSGDYGGPSPAVDTSIVYYAYSQDGGSTWTHVEILNDGGNADYQFAEPMLIDYPTVPAYPMGRLYGATRIVGDTMVEQSQEIYSNDGGRTWYNRDAEFGQNIIENPPHIIKLPSDHLIMVFGEDGTSRTRIYFSDRILPGTGYPTWQGYTGLDLTYGYHSMVHLGGGKVGIAYMKQSGAPAIVYYQEVDFAPEIYQLENSRLAVGEVYPQQNYAINRLSEWAGQFSFTSSTAETTWVDWLTPLDQVFITQKGGTPAAGNRSVDSRFNFFVAHSDSTITADFNYWTLRPR